MEQRAQNDQPVSGRQLYWAAILALLLGLTALYQAVLRNDGGMRPVRLGALVLLDVRATISPGLGDEVLLGMSFLKNFSIVQEGDMLIIASSGET